MANTQFLLQSNSLFQHSFHFSPFRSSQIKWPVSVSGYPRFAMNHSPYKIITTSPIMKMKCFITNDHKPERENDCDENGDKKDKDLSKIENVLKALVLFGLLFVYDNGRFALAASGGRMGGSSFSSSRSSSTSSTSYSSPSSSSSTSYSTWVSMPGSSSESYSSQISSPACPKSENEPGSKNLSIFVNFFVVACMGYFLLTRYDDKNLVVKTSVLMLQVGLLGTAKSLQADLNGIAEVADTSTPKGLRYILQEATLALLRHPDYCISGYSSVDVKRSQFECEKRFKNLSIKERGKFDEETLVNVNNIKKKSATSQKSNGICSEYIVVTIIVAATGVLGLPPIKSSAELKEALQKLASISSNNILAAEVLWTPQQENDCLTEQNMLEDYPMLQPL